MWIYTKRRYPNQTKRHLDSFHWRLPSVRCVAGAARAEQHAFLPGKKKTCGLTQSMPGMKLKCGDRYPKMCWERILVIHVRGNKYVMEGHGAEGNQFRMFQERPSFSVDWISSLGAWSDVIALPMDTGLSMLSPSVPAQRLLSKASLHNQHQVKGSPLLLSIG